MARVNLWTGVFRSTRRSLICLLAGAAVLHTAGQAADTSFTLSPRFREPFKVDRCPLPHHTVSRPTVGLVLSGGGSRGVAQIGVIRALERHGIPIDFIAATSMGAIVGGLYAAGYSTQELESLAVNTDWDEVLSLGDDTQRSQLFIDQKAADDRSFIAVRFEGLRPVLPTAVSTGQRLTDFLSVRLLQALYQPYPDFDNLRIPFRAVATDLVSGNRVVLRDGSLSEALRASATVPLLFTPIDKEGMQLVDGGLVSNVPVDLAREAGCDMTIIVNSTSGLRTADEMKAPWQTADQIMGIMMQEVNRRQIHEGDIVITPDIGRHLSSNFRGLDSLIRKGEETTERHLEEITALYRRKADSLLRRPDSPLLPGPVVIVRDPSLVPDSVWRTLPVPHQMSPVSADDIQILLGALYEHGDYQDVTARVCTGSGGTHVEIRPIPNPVVRTVRFSGCQHVSDAELQHVFRPMIGRVVNFEVIERAMEQVLRLYRTRGFSLAHIAETTFDPHSGDVHITLDEGIIDRIEVQGGVRTQDAFVLQEFPLAPGDVFEMTKARTGIAKIAGTTLFEYVYLEIPSLADRITVTIRIKERPAQLVRLGMRADNERHLQGTVDIRDENFRGTGLQLGLTVAGGQRNGDIVLEYKAQRLFDTYLSLGVSAFHRTFDSYVYGNAALGHPNRWQRDRIGEYRDIRYGVAVSFGSFLERLGNATAEFVLQNVRLVNLENQPGIAERYQLALARFATVVDTKNDYPFPTRGVGLKLSYEFSLESLGSDVGYNALQVMYENYASWGEYVTFHPRLTVGFADKTMPLAQQFRLGGRELFYGLREDDRRGRQMIVVNMEFRTQLPVRLLFDTYVRARYDLATISAVPEEIKFSSLLHGVGLELALATPVGPAVLGAGKAFYFSPDLPNQPVQQGPFLFYFMIGYQL